MATPIKNKATFGSAMIDHFSPKLTDSPKAINVHVSFEEALKLHLSLGQALGKLNGYNRSTKQGRDAAVNLCIYTQQGRIAVVEGKTQAKNRK
jgi:hypothetical protein